MSQKNLSLVCKEKNMWTFIVNNKRKTYERMYLILK